MHVLSQNDHSYEGIRNTAPELVDFLELSGPSLLFCWHVEWGALRCAPFAVCVHAPTLEHKVSLHKRNALRRSYGGSHPAAVPAHHLQWPSNERQLLCSPVEMSLEMAMTCKECPVHCTFLQ